MKILDILFNEKLQIAYTVCFDVTHFEDCIQGSCT